MKKILVIVFLTMCILPIISACSDLEYETEQSFTSPSGKRTVTVKCDYVSRPFVFMDDEMIFETGKSGFAETVGWNVEWISEDEIKLYVVSPQKEKYNKDVYYIRLDE